MAVALGQGIGGARLHQLPDGQATSISRSSRRLIAGEKTEYKRMGERALFRRLHADRGGGGARRRHAAVRANEGRRPGRSAHRPLAPCRGTAAPGQCRRHLVEHGRFPDQAEACRAGPAVPHYSRPRTCRVCATGRAAPQHLPAIARVARPDLAAQVPPDDPFCRSGHRLRGVCRKRGGRADGRSLRRGGAGGHAACSSTGGDGARRAPAPYYRRGGSPRAISR